ncbi:MAG: extracellular solute-binding protein [Acholeplasmatales bacterium]|jgi:ABC-type glycerol-3-phosphate transport system substrate-binding protein|nr:extracellular solute-binding protein [Acholeplasmatales bacterium]
MIKKILIVLNLIFIPSFILSFSNVSYFYAKEIIPDDEITFSVGEEVDLKLQNYDDVYKSWKNKNINEEKIETIVITPSDYSLNEVTKLTSINYDYLYEVVDFVENSSILVSTPYIEKEGLYLIAFDYYSTTGSDIRAIETSLFINNTKQYQEMGQYIFKTYFNQDLSSIIKDRYQNDITPVSTQVSLWKKAYLIDSKSLIDGYLLVKLEEGINEIKLEKTSGSMLLGNLYIESNVELLDYESYLNYHNHSESQNYFKVIEAENYYLKNTANVRIGSDREPSITPYSLLETRINVVDGSSFKKSGNMISYLVTVENPGLYNITIKAKSSGIKNQTFFRSLYINGEIPFKEAISIPLPYYNKYTNYTLSDENSKPLYFYLDKGSNIIDLVVNSTPYKDIYYQISEVLDGLNNLAIDIKKLTGNNLDETRDWEITDYLPNLERDLKKYTDELKDAYKKWYEIPFNEKDNEISSVIKSSYERLEKLCKKPNEITKKINVLINSSGSITQILGGQVQSIITSPLSMDKIYIHSKDYNLPKPNLNFFVKAWIGIKRFFLSFFDNRYLDKANKDELEIWVNRSRQYVDLIQQMADQDFTNQTNIKVKVSIMASEDKLILSNSANKQPDIAMGIAAWRPYEFAVRNAALDLRTFDDFGEVSSNFQKGSFLQLSYGNGIYAIPDSQNYNILFYRTDILKSLNIDPIFNTWEDIISILPILQRFAMNFYIPLSNNSSFKSFNTTMPFIDGFKGSIYSLDAMTSSLNEERTLDALRFMTELYTIYSLPLEVGSFFNSFRNGNIPIGIGDFPMYVQLLHAAPEIANLWNIAIIPGIEYKDEINRAYVGASTSSMIFSKSDKKDEAWKFLKWWSSKQVQLSYSSNLIQTFGEEYMWNTSNLEAFKEYPWNKEHKDVFLETLKYCVDTPKIPGSYMIERELSNIWNKVVLSGINLRQAMEESKEISDKELKKKMIEFKYLSKNGSKLKDYIYPTIFTIDDWLKGYNEN